MEVCLGALLLLMLALPAHHLPAEDRGKPTASYDGSWEPLQKMPIPAWFDDGKIGIFIHRGPYSVIGYHARGRGYAEHVPGIMYRDPNDYYPYFQNRWGAHPPEFGYKDTIPEFTAENWDPNARAFQIVTGEDQHTPSTELRDMEAGAENS